MGPKDDGKKGPEIRHITHDRVREKASHPLRMSLRSRALVEDRLDFPETDSGTLHLEMARREDNGKKKLLPTVVEKKG
jgi:hypothetical protein